MSNNLLFKTLFDHACQEQDEFGKENNIGRRLRPTGSACLLCAIQNP